MENGDTLGDNYSVIERLGSGGQAVVYLVREIKSGIQYVAKLINNEDEDKDEDNYNLEIKLNQKISTINPPNLYILRYFKHGITNFNRKGNCYENVPYLILEYAPKGDLYKYIDITGGFGEKYGKLLFQKILLGIQACHNIGVFHLDLKVENILLDDKYNPKICDFGLGSDNSGILKGKKGTKSYMPPQILENKEYTGIKTDIFYLGCLLFIIVVGCPCFSIANKDDDHYQYIINKDLETYFNHLEKEIEIFKKLSLQFKELFTRMIAYEETDRPENIQEILDDIWFNEIKENRNELENGLKQLFLEKENKVTDFIEVNRDYIEQNERSYGDNRNEIKKFDKEIFSPGIIPKTKNINLDMDSHIKIKGNLNCYIFMNVLLNKIQEKFQNCIIDNKNAKTKYECNIIFEQEESDEEEKDNDNLKLKLNNKKNNNEDCIINLELFKTENEEYILRFLRLSGSLGEFYSKVNQFICLAKDLL